MVGCQFLHACRKFVLDPLQDEAIWRDDGHDSAVNLAAQRFDPRHELLWRQFILELRETQAPETRHQQGERIGAPGRGAKQADFNLFGPSYPQGRSPADAMAGREETFDTSVRYAL